MSEKLAGQLLRPRVDAIGGAGNRSGRHFEVTFQEPDPAGLLADVASLEKEFGLAAIPRITAIEISVDWRPKDRSDQSRWLMTSVMHRHFLPEAQWFSGEQDKPRFTYLENGYKKTTKLYDAAWRKRYEAKALAAGGHPRASRGGRPRDPLAGHNAPLIDSTLYYGAREAEVMYRVQDKITDQRNGMVAVMLDQANRRTRVEVTISNQRLSSLELMTVDDLYGFSFEKKIAPYFGFWLPTVDLRENPSDVQIEIFRKSGVFGLEVYAEEGWTASAGRGSTSARLAYDKPKQQTYQALLRLTRRWGRGRMGCSTAIAA